jgi:hypothetical protein
VARLTVAVGNGTGGAANPPRARHEGAEYP